MNTDDGQESLKLGQAPLGYAVSARKFFIMNIFTCFLYKLYWAYRQYRFVAPGSNNKFFAGLCGLFLPISFYALMTGLEKAAADRGLSLHVQRKMGLAIGFFLLSFIVKFMEAFALVVVVGSLSCLLLYQLQKQINAINATIAPGNLPDNKFTVWDLTGILLTCGILAFIAIARRI